MEKPDYVGQQFGNYRLIDILGDGGFAKVYLGEHVYLNTQAAIKIPIVQAKGGMEDNFLLEAGTIACLKHPHIVRLLEYGVQDHIPFLVIQYAPKGSLRKRHPKDARLPPMDILEYVKPVAAALQYAHEEELVHRDVKPENMLLGRRNQVLLSDFGISTVSFSIRYDEKQAVIGTPQYMSPEQWDGEARSASDQYSLAIVVYEWLCGTPPFSGNIYQLMAQHKQKPPPPLHEKVPTIPPMVEEAILIALAKDPKQRFASIRAFAHALEQAWQGK